MRRMIMKDFKSGYLLPFALLSALLTVGACESTSNEPKSSQVDSTFSSWDSTDSPGCAVLVLRDGQVLHEKGYGMADLEHGIPIGPDTVFYTGSVSKQFVAMSLLLLEEQGRLSLDDDIRTYLPEFPDYGEVITLKHLVYHTSGIRDYLELWLMSGRNYLDEIPETAAYEIIRRQKQLNFPPGERHLYSNSCYFLIPLIVERVTGQTFNQFAEENIFQPLGMKDSHFHDDNGHIIPDRAFGYEKGERGFRALHMRFDLVGSGGLYSTVRDLARWDANFDDNRLGKGSPELIEKAHVAGVLNSGEELSYAFALVNGSYRGLRTVSHGGSLGGYRAYFLRFPEQRFSVIILANLGDIEPGKLAHQVADLYLSDLYSEELPGEDQPSGEATGSTEAPVVADLAQFEGAYFSDELETRYWLEANEGSLQLRIGWNAVVDLSPVARDRFKGSWFEIGFLRDPSGRVSSLVVDSGRVKGLRFERQ